MESLVIDSNPTSDNFLQPLLKNVLQWSMSYVSIHYASNEITCAKIRLKQMGQLTKAMANVKREH